MVAQNVIISFVCRLCRHVSLPISPISVSNAHARKSATALSLGADMEFYIASSVLQCFETSLKYSWDDIAVILGKSLKLV